MSPRQATKPTTEIGTATGYEQIRIPGSPWSNTGTDWMHQMTETENVPEWLWPNSVIVAARMRNDPQIEALWRGATLPIRRYRWSIDPNGAPTNVYTNLIEDLRLPLMDKPIDGVPRSNRRFNFANHIRQALNGPLYGHYFFEQVGVIDPDGMWRLRKLAARRPETIMDVSVAEDGGLEWIQQNQNLFGRPTKRIPVNRLVHYSWEQDGANWYGRSLLRAAYQPYIIKDELLRIMLIRNARNGMGVPMISAMEDATPEELTKLHEIATLYKIGEGAGGVLPNGAEMKLLGVEGTLPDILADIRYQDEQMARLMLQMFAQLGTTSYGSRALSNDFISWFGKAQESIADWFVDLFNMHVIEDWVDWNYGESTPAPILRYDKDENPELSMADIAAGVAEGILVADDDLEAWIRKTYGLPIKAVGAPPRPQPKSMQDGGEPKTQARGAAQPEVVSEPVRASAAVATSAAGVRRFRKVRYSG